MLNRSKHIDCRQSGFTLVEVAIVLVIIGLLIGGILKGQAMVESSKVKALAKDFSSVITAINAYQDKFRAIPGDDANAAANVSGTAPTTAGEVGNGLIDGVTWVGINGAPLATNESSLFWQHTRLAGLLSGSAVIGQGTNAIGGILGVTTNALHVTFPAGVSANFTVCSSGIPGKLAKQLDKLMDDGDATTGTTVALSMASSAPANGPCITAIAAGAAYVDTAVYTVCVAY